MGPHDCRALSRSRDPRLTPHGTPPLQVMGMNSTMGTLENQAVLYTVYCAFFDVVVHTQIPSYPKFRCQQ